MSGSQPGWGWFAPGLRGKRGLLPKGLLSCVVLSAALLLGACNNDEDAAPAPADTPDPPAVNTPPLANAGVDQTVDSGATVTLDGSASGDAEGAIASHAWTQTAGDAVVLAGAATATATFTAPAGPASLGFQLTVTDAQGASHSDTVVITVNAPPPPVAAAPVIVRQPTNPDLQQWGSVLFFVVASGEELNYEWRSSQSGYVMKSGPEPFLQRPDSPTNTDGSCFYVVVSNSAGSVTSEPGCMGVTLIEDVYEYPLFERRGEVWEDDAIAASEYGNLLLWLAQHVAGALVGPNFDPGGGALATGLPPFVFAAASCAYSGSFIGATLDGVELTETTSLPLGHHTLSLIWDGCRSGSDTLIEYDGGMLVDYDFPERFGEGSVTYRFSGYWTTALWASGLGPVSGTVHATIQSHDAGPDRWDDIQISLEQGVSSRSLVVNSPGATVSLVRRYSSDGTMFDEGELDFDVRMQLSDASGPRGNIHEGPSTFNRVTMSLDPAADPPFSTEGILHVGFGGEELADLEIGSSSWQGWKFVVLPPDECPVDACVE